MKKHLLTLIASLAVLLTIAQTEKPDLVLQNLKGKVKSVNEIEYDAVEKFGEVEKGAKSTRIYREFNNAGFETQFVHESFDEEEKDVFQRTTRYENNKVVEIKEDDNGDVEISKLKYNTAGQIESIDGVDRKGNLMYRQKNKYNSEGLLVQADTYKSDGSPDMKSISSYNSKKQLVKEETYNKDGKMIRLHIYTYDSRSNILEESFTNYEKKEPRPWIRKYAYDDNGRRIKEDDYMIEYNTQGDVTKKEGGYEDEKKIYTYDSQNNWVKCVITKKDLYGKTSFEIIERQIKYY